MHKSLHYSKIEFCSQEYPFPSDFYLIKLKKTRNQFVSKSFLTLSGLLYYRNIDNPSSIEEAKEYFHRAIQNGKQLESYHKLAEIYKTGNNFPKAIEMLESTLP